jgi:hypothetical protein
MATAQLAQIAGRYVQLSQKEIKSRISEAKAKTAEEWRKEGYSISQADYIAALNILLK